MARSSAETVAGCNGQPLAVASLGNQKRYMSLYLHALHGEREAGT